MDGELEARVTVRLADGKRGPFGVPRWETLSVGRTTGYGLMLRNSWVPSKLCRFLSYDHGWVVQVGPRVRMRVQDDYVGDHVFRARAMVAVQEGKTLLSFPELDDFCQLGLDIGIGVAAGLETVHDSVIEEVRGPRTAYGAARVALTPKQRERVATTFAYLIRGEPKPVNITAAAAEKLGVSEPAVKKTLGDVRDKVNDERWGPDLEKYEQVGEYLTQLTRTVGLDDLPPHLRQ